MSFAKTKAILLILAAALIILSACAPATAPTDVPAAQTITVQRTESLAWVDPLFSACVPDQAGVGLLIQSQPLTNLNLSAAEVTLRWDEPPAPEGYGAVLGSDEVVVVMPNDNPMATISADQLKAILSGGARQWSELCADCSALPEGEINLYIFPSDQEAQSILAVDLGLSAPLSSFATLVPDLASMLDAVSADPNAIGILPARALDERVKRVEITGLEQKALNRPLLAFTTSEPQGAIRELLSCVQQAITP